MIMAILCVVPPSSFMHSPAIDGDDDTARHKTNQQTQHTYNQSGKMCSRAKNFVMVKRVKGVKFFHLMAGRHLCSVRFHYLFLFLLFRKPARHLLFGSCRVVWYGFSNTRAEAASLFYYGQFLIRVYNHVKKIPLQRMFFERSCNLRRESGKKMLIDHWETGVSFW